MLGKLIIIGILKCFNFDVGLMLFSFRICGVL